MPEIRSYTSETAEPGENALEGVKFTLDGETFACQGWLSFLDASQLSAAADDDEMGTVTAAGIAVLYRFLRRAFGPAEYRRFDAHIHRHRTPDDVLLQIARGLREEIEEKVEAAAERPTVPPRGSSGTPPGDQGERISRVISLQTGDVQIVKLGDPEKKQPEGTPPAMARKTRKRSAG